MSSNWYRAAELWLRGAIDVEELVVEAALEGQLIELEHYFRQHPPSIGSQPLTRPFLERFVCQCAYALLDTANIDRAVDVIRNVRGEEVVGQWLRDAVMASIDPPMRCTVIGYLRRHSLLNEADITLIKNLGRVVRVYPVESYLLALEGMKSSSRVTFVPYAHAQLETALSSFFPRRRGAGVKLMEDVRGLALPSETLNLWADVAVSQEGRKRGSEPSTPRSEKRLERLASPPLFFRGAVEWMNEMDEDSVQRVILEGEILTSYFNGCALMSHALEDLELRWKAQLSYFLSHHMLFKALERLDSIPPSYISTATINIRQNHVEVLRFEGCTLNIDLRSFCTSAARHALGEKLLSQGVWFQTRWESVEQWIGFIAKCGALFGTTTVHEEVKTVLKSEHVAALVTEFCIRHELPTALQSFLESNDVSTELNGTMTILRAAGPCDWAQWLILSRVPDQCFAATIANAKCVLAAEGISVKSLSDLAHAGSIYVVLTAMAHSPRPMRHTLLLDPPVLRESPSQREELLVEDGMLCLVDPVCCLADIQPQLQESFPETCQALTAVAYEEKERKDLTFSEFRAWRNRMLRIELADIGFLDMVMTSGIQEIEDILKMNQLITETPTNPSQSESSQFWEETQLQKLRQKVKDLCHSETLEGMSIGVCCHIINERPMAALEWFLAAKPPSSPALTKEDLTFLELLTRLVALWFFKDSSVVFSALLFAAACGINTSKIKIDVAALQRLEGARGTDGNVPALMDDLTTEVAMEYDATHHSDGNGYASAKILGCLENVVLGSCSFQPSMSMCASGAAETQSALSESTDVILKWSLVHAFAKLHKRAPTKRLLHKLAQADDWILFLAEANYYQSSIDEVIQIAKSHFADRHLGHHVSYILEGHHSLRRKASALSSLNVSTEFEAKPSSETDVHRVPVSEELFDILLEAEQSGRPIQVLLVWARHLRWRLLCVVAACYSHSAYLECMVTWLDIGIYSCTETAQPSSRADTSTLSLDVSREQILEQLMSLVFHLCHQGHFDELLHGFSLFPVVPLVPVKHFLKALKYYRMHMFNATSQHLTAFEDALDKEIKKSASLKETMSASMSSTVSAMTAALLDVELVDKITQSAIMALLRDLSPSFEREKLLELLNRMEIDDSLSWLRRLRLVRHTYNLLRAEADTCIDWSSPARGFDLPSVDIQHVLERLKEERNWTGAREWALENDLSVEEITRSQADALAQEWMEIGFEEDLYDILWEQINQIFVDHSYPPLKAGLFFLQQATRAKHTTIKFLLLEALHWVDGTRLQGFEQAPRVVHELRRSLYLLDSDGDIIQALPDKVSVPAVSGNEKCPAVQLVLRPVREAVTTVAVSEITKSSEISSSSSPTFDQRSAKTFQRMEVPTISLEERQCVEILEEIMPKATDEQVQRAIKLLLDNGQVEAAESIQQSEKLAARIEFFLVDTSLAIIHRCGSNGWNGESAEKVVLMSILTFLKKKGHLDSETEPKPQDVLDAVVLACKDSGGYPVCARAAVAFRAAALLNMSCVELASYGPDKALELLLLKGEETSEVAREFVSAFEFSPRATAKKVAQMYLNSLMGTSLISRINENEPVEETPDPLDSSSEIIENSVICSDSVEIGNALMQLLVERHCALPAEIEAAILVQSYLCYERVGYVEGLDVLLELTTSRVYDFAADEKYEAMIKLSVGICKFDGLPAALDVIIQNKKLDLLFQDTNSHNPSTISTLRSAILSSIYKHSPKDSETWNATYRQFNMHVEVGQGLKDKAMELLEEYSTAGRLTRDQRLMQAMDLLIRAAAEFSCAQCSSSAADCGALVALVAQQICNGERKWVSLSDSECRELLPQLSDIHSALIVARAYKFNSPQDWVLTLWQHMLNIAKEHNGKGPNSASLAKALRNMLDYSRNIMKEIVFSEEHLEQVMHMYTAFPRDEASFEPLVSYEVLTQCVIQFLQSVSDVRMRWTLCRSMQGEAKAQHLIQECRTILDMESTTT